MKSVGLDYEETPAFSHYFAALVEYHTGPTLPFDANYTMNTHYQFLKAEKRLNTTATRTKVLLR
jgi:hypothetical protein